MRGSYTPTGDSDDERIKGSCIDCRGHKVGKINVGDKAPALLDLQNWLFAGLPFDDANLAVEHPGIDTDVRNWFSQAERNRATAYGPHQGSREPQGSFMALLIGRAALMNRSQRQAAGQTRRRCTAVYPRQLKRDERERKILWSGK